MTKLRALLGAVSVLFVLVLGACSSNSAPPPPNFPHVTPTSTSPTPDFTTPSEAPSTDESTPSDDSTLSALDQAFVADVQANVDALSTYDPADIVTLGNLVCQDFADGLSVDSVLSDVSNIPGISPYDIGYFTGDSVSAYCPEYVPVLQNYLATAGPSA